MLKLFQSRSGRRRDDLEQVILDAFDNLALTLSIEDEVDRAMATLSVLASMVAVLGRHPRHITIEEESPVMIALELAQRGGSLRALEAALAGIQVQVEHCPSERRVKLDVMHHLLAPERSQARRTHLVAGS
jgi:hypothetical protein